MCKTSHCVGCWKLGSFPNLLADGNHYSCGDFTGKSKWPKKPFVKRSLPIVKDCPVRMPKK